MLAEQGRGINGDGADGSPLWVWLFFVTELGAGTGDLPGAVAISEQPIVANLDQALRQDVQTEAAEELDQSEFHFFAPAFVGIIFIAEKDCASSLIQGEQTAVADCDAVGVARKISEHRFRPGEGLLAIDDPRLGASAVEQPGKLCGLGERRERSMKAKLPLLVEFFCPIAELGSEHPGEGTHGKEITPAGALPLFSVEGKPTSGDDAVEMVMSGEGLTPGVEHRGEANLRFKLMPAELEQRGAD